MTFICCFCLQFAIGTLMDDYLGMMMHNVSPQSNNNNINDSSNRNIKSQLSQTNLLHDALCHLHGVVNKDGCSV